MTRTQFLSLLSAAGVGFLGGTLTWRSGPPASVLAIHALRVETGSSPRVDDGGVFPDGGSSFVPGAVLSYAAPTRITAYRTKAMLAADGGAILTDEGPADCTGNVTPLFDWAARACDAGVVLNVRVVELRPRVAALGADGGVTALVALEVYGDTDVQCVVPRPAALAPALAALVCVGRSAPRGSDLGL